MTEWSTPSRGNSKAVTPTRRRLNVPPDRTMASRRAAEPFSAMTRRRTETNANPPLKGATRRLLRDDGLRLNLHEDFRADQSADLDQRRCGAHVPEEVRVGPPHPLPVVDVRHVRPRADDVFEASARGAQGLLDVPDGLHGLRVRVPQAD